MHRYGVATETTMATDIFSPGGAARAPGAGLAESVAHYDAGPSTARQAAMSLEIDAILDRLGAAIPKFHQEMDALLERVRRPTGV